MSKVKEEDKLPESPILPKKDGLKAVQITELNRDSSFENTFIQNLELPESKATDVSIYSSIMKGVDLSTVYFT